MTACGGRGAGAAPELGGAAAARGSARVREGRARRACHTARLRHPLARSKHCHSDNMPFDQEPIAAEVELMGATFRAIAAFLAAPFRCASPRPAASRRYSGANGGAASETLLSGQA